MNDQQKNNYDRIAEAIHYLKNNFKSQPHLDEVAEKMHLSPYHFQRLFTEWAGVSPKQFLQYVSVEHAKQILKNKQATLFDAAYETGLSGTGRLHDLFVKIEGMTPGEFKGEGEHLVINYDFAQTPFGNILIASTTKGICSLIFEEDEANGLKKLKANFPKAQFQQAADAMQQNALHVFTSNDQAPDKVKLHLKGTDFQLKVWQALLKIPLGKLSTYGAIAADIQQPKASRAVGTAVGSNPIAYIIPCHRVIQSSGVLGNYMWGATRKLAIVGWECAQVKA